MSKAVTVRFGPGGLQKIQLYVTKKTAKKTASQVRKLTGADVVINASLYDSNKWVPNCDVKADGKVLNDDKYSYRGLGWNSGEGVFHVVTSGEMKNYDNFLSCVLLVWNGVAYPYHADAAVSRRGGRTVIIGLKDGSTVLRCFPDGNLSKTPKELQTALLGEFPTVDWALMLDGGGSVQLSQEGDEYIYSTRRVHNYLCFWRKQTDSCPYPEPTALVRQGSSGDGARWVQWQLQRHGGDLAVDGSFGAESDRTLRAFQLAYGLEVDGICGPATRARLKAEREEKTVRAVLFAAASQVGVTESPAGSNCVKYNTAYYGRKVSGNAYPWCMAFVWWVFRQAGMSLYKTASCSALVGRYKAQAPGQVIRGNYRPGDIVFFDFTGKRTKTEHVGIVESVAADGTLTTIEGNTGTGNDANGGAVMRRTRKQGLVTCAVRPGYPGE
uniref:Lysozyme family protein n=1 Tax=Myoviridae sp. ctPVE25 TaxID=2826649 RepID=A0A8S5R0W5_9CAUD|nr:MAG TPA: lysozyme family protein [Myoviridae sp. ctPVE25]